MGGNGLEKVSKINFEKGQKLAKEIEKIGGFSRIFSGIHFNEFVIKCEKDVKKINQELLKRNIQGGLILENWYPNLKNCLLFGITEMHNDEDIEKLVNSLKEASNV